MSERFEGIIKMESEKKRKRERESVRECGAKWREINTRLRYADARLHIFAALLQPNRE